MRPDIMRTVAEPRPAPHRQFLPVVRPEGRLRALYDGEPETCRRDPRAFLATLAHLGLLLAVLRVYKLEFPPFRALATLAAAALPIHYLLPFRLKGPFFVAASIAGLAWIFGPTATAVVLMVAALLIGTCYLPIAWSARAAIVAALMTALALARGPLGQVLPDSVWPVVGTLFMFRMILYLYELKHADGPEPLADTLGYFFLLPNAYFHLFPVVDYRTFRRGYFAEDVHATQRAGLRLMLRGALHLLAYRVVYHELLIRPEDVVDLATLAGFLTCNYLCYLHVSGQFHLAVGMLHLFGYTLPPTHRNYLLATGFTDYWRRINIYWKDFMVRTVFNPVAFRLKRRPQWQALAAATAAVFVATWLLHAYQSFWLRGRWGFSLQDALFWGILGALVLVNVQLDARAPRRRPVRGADRSPRALAVRAAKTLGTFATIALLWSLWTSAGVGAWLGMMRRALAG